MRKLIFLLLFASIFSGCDLQKKTEAPTAKVDDSTPASPAQSAAANYVDALSADDKDAQRVLGSYVGSFGDNKITLLVTKIGGGTVSGRSVVGGNDRPFDGTYKFENASYAVTAREPGDHKDDGTFEFSFAVDEPGKITGTWKANDPKRPQKSYTLDRRKFEYKANVGEYPEASTRLLKAADVENMMKEDLQFMRNEIFARHGYCFNKKEMRQMFENADWYVPNTIDIRGHLTDIEKKNIELIKRYEKYADEYGDEFGR